MAKTTPKTAAPKAFTPKNTTVSPTQFIQTKTGFASQRAAQAVASVNAAKKRATKAKPKVAAVAAKAPSKTATKAKSK